MYAFLNNEIIPLEEARIPVTTHAFHYGTGCFEGIRGNWNPEENQLYVFRPMEHFERLISSAKVLRIGVRFSAEELCGLADKLIQRSNIKDDQYIRPVAYKSAQVVANLKAHELEDEFMMLIVYFRSSTHHTSIWFTFRQSGLENYRTNEQSITRPNRVIPTQLI